MRSYLHAYMIPTALQSYCMALTITTFNILAPVHRSIDNSHRESEREDWWRPRIEGVASYIADAFVSIVCRLLALFHHPTRLFIWIDCIHLYLKSESDVVMLQEWWFDDAFTSIFEEATGNLFDRITARRPAIIDGQVRDDGLCCLIRKNGKLELMQSYQVSTGPTRISQLVHCRERCIDGSVGRTVYLANSHLSFPSDENPFVNDERQANEIKVILEALSTAASQHQNESLQIICGDFNSNSHGLAASLCESNNYVNCASATAQQMLSNIGGPINLGVTHYNHLGEHVSVDHIFLRLNKPQAKSAKRTSMQPKRCTALAMGYLDTKGSRIMKVHKEDLIIEGKLVLSDHRPVTVTIDWPRILNVNGSSSLYGNVTMPLDPLEPAWGIVP